MAWCLQASSHYLSPCWPRSMSPYGVIRAQWVNYRCLLLHSNNLLSWSATSSYIPSFLLKTDAKRHDKICHCYELDIMLTFCDVAWEKLAILTKWQFGWRWRNVSCYHYLPSIMKILACAVQVNGAQIIWIYDSHEIAILEFPTSDCSQNEAWCHAKRTDVTVPIENTWRRPNQHCKFNALVARIDDHSIVFNYAVWARCYHTVLN